MSHFSVCVVVPQENPADPVTLRGLDDQLTTILAPYDEQTEEMQYREFEDRTDEAIASYETDTVKAVRFPDGTIRSTYDREFSDHFYVEDGVIYAFGPKRDRSGRIQNEATKALEYIPDHSVKLMYPTFEMYCDEYCGYVKNEDGLWGYTHNPQSKWDWWVIGGRFSGNFLVKADLEDCVASGSCDDEKPTNVPQGYKYVDAARKKDICWDLMRQLLVDEVAVGYQKCVEAFASKDLKGFGPLTRITDEGIAGWGHMIYLKGETLDEYKARRGATEVDLFPISSYAVVNRDGEWAASGDMGWFGISSNDKDERAWNDEIQTLMKDVQDDDYIVIVDCHI